MNTYEINIKIKSSFSRTGLEAALKKMFRSFNFEVKKMEIIESDKKGVPDIETRGKKVKHKIIDLDKWGHYVFDQHYTRSSMQNACATANYWSKKTGYQFIVSKDNYHRVIITRTK